MLVDRPEDVFGDRCIKEGLSLHEVHRDYYRGHTPLVYWNILI
jgi:hypothetical protein